MLHGLYSTGKSLELDVSYKVIIACSALFHLAWWTPCIDAAVWTPLAAHGDAYRLNQSLPTTAQGGSTVVPMKPC